LWKGAITFGLIHIPVSLHSATSETGTSFKLVDSATMNPVGNQRINKVTGKPITPDKVSKAMELDDGSFVVLTEDEIRSALPKATQVIELEAFVKLTDIPLTYFEKPYYVAPIHKGQKVYALLREVLRKTGRAGLGRVVVSSKQNLAIVLPDGDGLVVNLLRWEDEVRSMTGLPLPAAGDVELSDRELKMGEQLVLELADEFRPERFEDDFRAQIETLAQKKVKAGQAKELKKGVEGDEPRTGASNVVDLTELLLKSLRNRGGTAKSAASKATPLPKKRAANEESARAVAASKPTKKATAVVKPAQRRRAG